MESKISTLIPNGIKKRILAGLMERERRKRRECVSDLPQALLQDRHIRNCRLLLNRSTLLSNLRKGGIAAELGVNRGEFSELILETLQPSKLHLVDNWGSDRFHSDLFEEVRMKLKRHIEEGRVEIHRKLSIDSAGDFPDGYFDLVYIDTDHSYKTTRDELLRYAPKIKNDGIIAGHDYSMGNWIESRRYGVIEAVHEFCVNEGWELLYLTVECLESQSFAIRRIQEGDEGSI